MFRRLGPQEPELHPSSLQLLFNVDEKPTVNGRHKTFVIWLQNHCHFRHYHYHFFVIFYFGLLCKLHSFWNKSDCFIEIWNISENYFPDEKYLRTWSTTSRDLLTWPFPPSLADKINQDQKVREGENPHEQNFIHFLCGVSRFLDVFYKISEMSAPELVPNYISHRSPKDNSLLLG